MTTPRYWCYVWEDISDPDHVKFGDHMTFEDNIVNAEQNLYDYIRGSLGKTKWKWEQNLIKVHKIWDVTHYEKTVGRFYLITKYSNIIGIT